MLLTQPIKNRKKYYWWKEKLIPNKNKIKLKDGKEQKMEALVATTKLAKILHTGQI